MKRYILIAGVNGAGKSTLYQTLDYLQGMPRINTVTPKMSAFLELEKMLIPVSQELDYDKELAEARDERHGLS